MSTYGTDLSYDVTLVISTPSQKSGYTYGGSITLTKAGGSPHQYAIYGNMDGDIFSMTTELDQGVKATIPLTVAGGTLEGEGSFVGTVSETYYVSINLKGGNGGPGGNPSSPDGLLPVAAMAAPLIGAVFGIIAVSIPAPTAGQTGIFAVEAGWPQPGGQSAEGIGVHQPALYDQFGRPNPPSNWGGRSPSCVNHPTVPCQVQYPFRVSGEPGSWFCPQCFKEGRGAPGEPAGYPWGRYR